MGYRVVKHAQHRDGTAAEAGRCCGSTIQLDTTQLFDDDRAVSPVIGVILMVAITVILAAVVGSFVLGLGNSVQQTSPNANFQFDFQDHGDDNFTVTATHTGGDTIPESENLTINTTDPTFESKDDFDPPVSAGDEASITNVSEGTVRVIWTSQNRERSQTLAEEQVPN